MRTGSVLAALAIGLPLSGAWADWRVPPDTELLQPITAPLNSPNQPDPDAGTLQSLRSRGLPTDIPLPEKTPFDDQPDLKVDYLDGYRTGYVEQLRGMIVTRCYGGPPPPVFTKGLEDGEEAGRKLHDLREAADRHRRYGFFRGPDSREVTADPMDPDRVVRDRFFAFAGRFEVELARRFPQTLAVRTKEGPDVYAYTFDDYSRSNSQPPVRRRCFKGTISLRAKVKEPSRQGPREAELQGHYMLQFDWVAERWVLEEAGLSGLMHLQKTDGRPDEPAGTYTSCDSALARELLRAAVDAAGTKTPATQPDALR